MKKRGITQTSVTRLMRVRLGSNAIESDLDYCGEALRIRNETTILANSAGLASSAGHEAVNPYTRLGPHAHRV